MQAKGKVLTAEEEGRGSLNCKKYIIKEKCISCYVPHLRIRLDTDNIAAWLCKVKRTADISGWPHRTLLNFTLIYFSSNGILFIFFKLFSLFLGCGQRLQEEQICLQDTTPSQELEFVPLMNLMIQTPKHLL